MNGQSQLSQYKEIDMPFYYKRIAPLLPEKVLDFHTHVWQRNQWILHNSKHDKEQIQYTDSATLGNSKASKYMSTQLDYTVDQLLIDGGCIFPDREYKAVCFGQPTPAVDTWLTNRYIAENTKKKSLFPLIIAGGGKIPYAELKENICRDGYFGYKVFLNWIGNDYGNIKIEDMLIEEEMVLADELKLVVLLHVPRSGRLADPIVQRGVRSLALSYPRCNIVLAHCGRCYHPDEIKSAIKAVSDLENVFMDTSMVMEPIVLEMAIRELGPERLLFGTDFPVAVMRGRRVNVMDHWVDIVRQGYPESDFRIASDEIHATYMAYEIVMAIGIAADMAGLSEEQMKGIFYDNGIALLRKVMDGSQFKKKLAE